MKLKEVKWKFWENQSRAGNMRHHEDKVTLHEVVLKICLPHFSIQWRKKKTKRQKRNLGLPSCVCLLNVSADTVIMHFACVNRSLTNPCLPQVLLWLLLFQHLHFKHLPPFRVNQPPHDPFGWHWLHCFTRCACDWALHSFCGSDLWALKILWVRATFKE